MRSIHYGAFNGRLFDIDNRRTGIMRIGVFADAHDHLDNIRRAVDQFNARECELVLFAGDLVSPMAVTPLRKLECPFIGCFGDNDGNKTGILGGMRIVGDMGEPPFGIQLEDGTRILLSHTSESIRGLEDEFHVIITAHSHRQKIFTDDTGRLRINPGETSGWTFRQPTIVILETNPLEAEIINLPAMPLPG